MKEKLTIIKVGGKIVEEEDSLCQLLTAFTPLKAIRYWYMAEDVPPPKSQPN